MREITGDIWTYHAGGDWIVITTNGFVKRDGSAVMGRGVALQAKRRFWNLADWLGFQIRSSGNHCHVYTGQHPTESGFRTFGLITFPVKRNWRERADVVLIERSCKELVDIADSEHLKEVYMVRPGCSNGKLDWEDVKPILEKYLDDRFTVVEIGRNETRRV